MFTGVTTMLGNCMNRGVVRSSTAVSTIIIALLTANGWGQKLSSYDRGRAQEMLHEISSDIKKHYYDPKFHGVNWDAKVAEMKQKINASDSMPRAMSEVAAALDALNDSHTFFLPPRHAYRHDYGWQAQMIGDRCFVLRVRPGSDGETKGVKPGDELVGLNGFAPNRENFGKMQYVFNTLRPQPGLRLDLRSPTGEQRQLDVAATVIEEKREVLGSAFLWEEIQQEKTTAYLGRAQFSELNGEVGILKFPRFFFAEKEIDEMIDKARKHKALVLDLRGNPGGSVETLKYLIGGFFEKEVKIGDRVGRSEHQPMIAKPHGQPFTGKLFVLVDSRSGSAAELFARVVQIEKRGTVLGDRSSGSVMEAKRYTYASGIGMVAFYGASITDADIIMTDGKSLEHSGVIPDEVMLPSAEDLAHGRDPVLSRAAEIVGAKLSPSAAGKLFPYEWPKI
jgi:carboxyl-terminal processing protease